MTFLPADSRLESSVSRGDQLRNVLGLIASLWIVYLADLILPLDFTRWGLVPRTLHGLLGIVLMPFLHGGFGHLLSNTVPLTILLILLAGTRKNAWWIAAMIALAGGALLWIFGWNAYHVGASGLVYGLATYLVMAGFLEKRLIAMFVAIAVLFVFGTSLFWGVLPIGNQGVSWDGHLLGGIGGALLAIAGAQNQKQATDRSMML